MEIEVPQERDLAERLNEGKKSFAELSKKFKYLIEHPQKLQKKKEIIVETVQNAWT